MHPLLFRPAKLAAIIAACLAFVIAVNAAPPDTFVTPADITADSFWRIDYWDFNPAESPSAEIAAAPVMLPGYGTSALNVIPGPGQGGSGCDRLGGKPHFGTQDLDGVTLSSINALSYSYLVDVLGSATPPGNSAPYINLFIDRNNDGIWRGNVDTILVYEPLYTRGVVTNDVWYTDVAIGDSANGRWHTAAVGITGIGAGSPVDPNDLWSEILLLDADTVTEGVQPVGDLKIVNPDPGCDASPATETSDEGTGSGFSIVVGQKSGDGWLTFEGFIDAIVLDVDGFTAQDVNLTLVESVTATAGTPQSAEAGFVFDVPLAVTLLDDQGAPVAGETVTFIASDNDGATATFPSGSTAVTNATGVASVVAVASTTEGVYNVTATADGRSVTFALTNVAQAAFTTELVLPQDLGGADDFWTVDYYDNDPVNSPSGTLAMNPAGVVNPLTGFGTSSFQMLPGLGVDTLGQAACARTGGKVFLGSPDLAGVKLKDLKAFSFALLMENTVNAEGQPTLYYPPYINIYVDLDGVNGWDPTVDSILVYDTAQVPNEPGNGPHTPLTWYETVAIGSGSTGAWRAAIRPFGGIPTGNTPNPAHTWSTIVSLPYTSPNGTTVGDLMIVNPDPGCDATADTDDEGTALGFNIQLGQKNGGSYNNSDHHVDKISVAVDGVLAPTTFDFALFDVPATIAITAGETQSATVDTAFATALEVEVKDANGSPVIGETVTFAAPASGASAVFTPANGQVVTNAAGKASIPVAANTVAGAYTVSAQIGALAPVNFSLTNTVGAAASIVITTGDDQTAQVNTAFATALEVEVKDAFANPVPGATVTFTAPASGASAALSTAAVTDALGKTSVTATANGTIGAYDVTAAAGALTPVAFSLENTLAASAAKIVIVSGNDQHATINTAFADPLVVKVTDAADNPVEGVTVQFAVLTRQASAVFTPADGQDVSDANGEASVEVTANSTIGSYQVVVTAGAVFSAFDLTNDPDPATELLVNGSFELAGTTAKIPSGWKPLNLTFDKRVCNVLHAADGTCALQFKGGVGENAIFKQIVGDISALTAGDTLYLSGAFKSASGSPKVTVMVKVKYANLPVQKIKLSFLTTQAAYAYADVSDVLTGTPVKIIVLIKNNSAGGKQYVDDVSLTFNNATRAAAGENGILPPPAAPAEFRGNN